MIRILGVLAAALVVCGCDRPREVVVYTSADEQVARPVFERFEKETGIHVAAKFDTEATKTTGLASVIRNEAQRPRADVFWSNEQATAVGLAADGLLAPSMDAAVTAWPQQWRAQDGSWCSFAGRARVVVYSPERVKEPPTQWTDLLRSEWKGKIAMADPRFGTTRGHLGAMKAYWDENAVAGYFEAWAEGLLENEPIILTSGNAGVVDAVARGEADLGLTDTDDVLAAQARGMAVAMVMPRHARKATHPGGGTLVVPNTVGVVKGAPHPEFAAQFVAFMLSPQTERQLAEMPAKHAPLVSAPQEGDLKVPDPLQFDLARAAGAANGAVEFFMRRKNELAAETKVVRPDRTAEQPSEPEDAEEDAEKDAPAAPAGEGTSR